MAGREVAIYRQRVVGSFQQIHDCKSKQAAAVKELIVSMNCQLIKKRSRSLRSVLNEHSESTTSMWQQPICPVNGLIIDVEALAS